MKGLPFPEPARQFVIKSSWTFNRADIHSPYRSLASAAYFALHQGNTMPHQQASTNAIMLILLRISLILVATLATLLLVINCMDDVVYGKIWAYLTATSGSLLIGSELMTLFRQLAAPAKPGPNHANRLAGN